MSSLSIHHGRPMVKKFDLLNKHINQVTSPVNSDIHIINLKFEIFKRTYSEQTHMNVWFPTWKLEVQNHDKEKGGKLSHRVEERRRGK